MRCKLCAPPSNKAWPKKLPPTCGPIPRWDSTPVPSALQPSEFSSNYINQQAQFDAGVGYLFERGKKRQHRLQAAQDQTTVTRSQVADSERQLTFNVAQQFVDVLLAESMIDSRSKTSIVFRKP